MVCVYKQHLLISYLSLKEESVAAHMGSKPFKKKKLQAAHVI